MLLLTLPKCAIIIKSEIIFRLWTIRLIVLTSQNRTIPRLALNLPPLSKGGGLTARHKPGYYCFLLAICPPFLYCKLFCRQDGGIVFLPHSFRFSDTSANNPSIVGSASHCNRSSPLHKGAKGDTALPTLSKTSLSYEKHNILARPRKG